VKIKNTKIEKRQSLVGVGKLLMWVAVVAVVLILRLCGFDVEYPRVTP
jgi:hypothetical protein